MRERGWIVAMLAAGCAVDVPAPPIATPIIGGSPVAVGVYPTVVAIDLPNTSLCTGTLVAPDLILTAAHCLDPVEFGYTTQDQVTTETVVHFDASGVLGMGDIGTRYRASATLFDPDFIEAGTPDLGLIWLGTPITDRMPSSVSFDAANAPVGIATTNVGYGIDDLNNAQSAGRENVVIDQPTTACAPYMASDATFLCADQTNQIGICDGDSGGPAFVTVRGVQMIVGVTSYTYDGCTGAGVHMRTDAGAAFLDANAPELRCELDGTCNASCRMGALPIDPDCPTCAIDSDCGADMACSAAGHCEPVPLSPGGLGAECGDGYPACQVGTCATGPDGMRCTQACGDADDATCPSWFSCIAVGSGSAAGSACWPSTGGGGCDAGGGAAGVLVGLVGLALVLASRARCVVFHSRSS